METSQERPEPAPAKLLDQFNDWLDGTELPGRTMAYLKTGRLPEVLDELEGESIERIVESWQGWEKGKIRPDIVLEVLKENGLAGTLAELAG